MPSPTRPSVLFIEDNLTQLDLYVLVLRDEFDIIQATRAETGYQLACSHSPDVIVTDVILPDADGLQLAARLRNNPGTADIPIVVLTGDDGAYARAQLVRSELTGVLMKPCPADRLASILNDAIRRVV